MVADLLRVIRDLAEQDKTVVIIEHDLGIVREAGDWVYVMGRGQIEAFGAPDEVLRDASLDRLMLHR
jgi:ABC-type histidine transport system ATPase subunit